MIHSARPTVSPVATIIFCCFVLLDVKSGDGRTDEQTDNMCKNNDHYQPGLWVGWVDQFTVFSCNEVLWRGMLCIEMTKFYFNHNYVVMGKPVEGLSTSSSLKWWMKNCMLERNLSLKAEKCFCDTYGSVREGAWRKMSSRNLALAQ